MALPARILIVEDERVLAQNLKKYLGRYAEEVQTADDGEQALRMLDSFAPDAVVLDYGLPGMDGLRTHGEIMRRRAGKVHCTMITGNPTERLVHDAHEQGITQVVCKPFSFSHLLQLLDQASPAEDAAGSSGECA